MTEPIYQFVKGEGWLIQTCESAIVTMNDGKRVRIERRVPKEGEYFIWHHKGEWDLSNWINWTSRNIWDSLLHKDFNFNAQNDYMVFVQL